MITEDPYVYTGTDVLRNTFDIRDAQHLEVVERRITSAAVRAPLPKISLSPEGYRLIHKHVFQDIYSWAGEYRTCNLRKDYWFEEHHKIENRMKEQFSKINAEKNLKGLRLSEFSRRAAKHLCELNDIHPFREGNGRTNRLFARELAAQAGFELKISQIDRKSWLEASLAGFNRTDYAPMANVIQQALYRRGREQDMGR